MLAYGTPTPYINARTLHAALTKLLPQVYTADGDVAKLVDALDLGSSAARCESSSLSVPTIICKCVNYKCVKFN